MLVSYWWADTISIIRNTCWTNVPVVGRQQKNLCSSQTNVLVVGGQRKNQSLMESRNVAMLRLSIKNMESMAECRELRLWHKPVWEERGKI